MVEFLEILNDDVEDENQMNIMLENGEWFPEEMSRAGDQPCILFDKKVFEIVGGEKPDGGHIPMRMIRRRKNDTIKSRSCLEDVAMTVGDELFVATPSLTLRTALTIASEWRVEQDGKEVGVIIGDVTQTMVHADMDELIITRVPKTMNGLTVKIEEKEIVLYEGLELIVLKALYGYRKSPKLWQAHFLKVLTVNFQCLKLEPVSFPCAAKSASISSRILCMWTC